jgi:hypothetical protein
MPRDSVEDARKWLETNKKPPGRPKGYRPGVPKSRAVGTLPVIAPKPVTGARSLIPGPTPEELLGRLEQIERLAYQHVLNAQGNEILSREAIRTHRDAATNLLAARGDWQKLANDERQLLSGAWVREMFQEHDALMVGLANAMPRALAARIAPHDPEAAEAELRSWVTGTFLRTLQGTNPFAR